MWILRRSIHAYPGCAVFVCRPAGRRHIQRRETTHATLHLLWPDQAGGCCTRRHGADRSVRPMSSGVAQAACGRVLRIASSSAIAVQRVQSGNPDSG